MTIEVVPRAEISEDLRNLPTNDLRFEAIGYLVRLRTEPYLGRPLGMRLLTGDLSDCRKIFFYEARYRILYLLLPDENRPKQADVIAIGPRAALAVYNDAVTRLGR